MPERARTLLDNLISPIRAVPYSRLSRAVLNRSLVARRYVLDESASTMVGEFLRDHLDLMLDSIEFARPPFPVTYVELDSRALFRAWRPEQPIQSSSDVAIGYLIDGQDVVVLAGGEDDQAYPAAVSFSINRPQSIPFSRLTELPEEQSARVKQTYVLGGRQNDGGPPAQGDTLHLPDLPSSWSPEQVAAHFDVRPTYAVPMAEQFVDSAFLGGGDPLILMVSLLLLNQPGSFVERFVPRATGIHKGKRKTYKEHNVISVSLTQSAGFARALASSSRASPIRHDVEGHWRNYNRHEGCEHAWEPVGAERTSSGGYRRYWCSKCLQRRTWTDGFTRGDALKGFATNEHRVTR